MIRNFLFSHTSQFASKNAAFHQIRGLATPAADRYKVLVVGGGSKFSSLNDHFLISPKSQELLDYPLLNKSTIDSN